MLSLHIFSLLRFYDFISKKSRSSFFGWTFFSSNWTKITITVNNVNFYQFDCKIFKSYIFYFRSARYQDIKFRVKAWKLKIWHGWNIDKENRCLQAVKSWSSWNSAGDSFSHLRAIPDARASPLFLFPPIFLIFFSRCRQQRKNDLNH